MPGVCCALVVKRIYIVIRDYEIVNRKMRNYKILVITYNLDNLRNLCNMDRELLILNINKFCESKGEKVTNACKSAGVGGSFVADIRRGQTPSVAKVADLAHYLGVTTSELLGEALPPRPFTEPELDDQLRKYMADMTPEELASFLALAKAIRDATK